MKVVLFQPEIPQNTGNIARTCFLTNSSLALVKPLGFSLSQRRLKRAGLDYWDEVYVEEIEDLDRYLEKISVPFWFFSSKAKTPYTKAAFSLDSLLIFGSETSGLPKAFYERWPEKFITIPMINKGRCLNLSNAVAIAIYEVLRQNS